MFLDYIKERYDADYFKPYTLEQVVEMYVRGMAKRDVQINQTSKGFITYRLEGDAVVWFDLYVKPEYRKSGQGWEFHDQLIKQGLAQDKRVMITFSEHSHKNRHLGLATAAAFGFVHAFETKQSSVFIKGIF